jgi:hypothetical protein
MALMRFSEWGFAVFRNGGSLFEKGALQNC